MYSLDFLEALTEMSLFYAKHGMAEKAITLAKESYDHTHSKSFENNIARITFDSHNMSCSTLITNQPNSPNIPCLGSPRPGVRLLGSPVVPPRQAGQGVGCRGGC